MIASRYEVISYLGSGGMGVVFKARDRVLGETVALKAARLSKPFDLRALERFRSEVRLARRVRHSNVCTVHDYGEDGDLVFLSMEYVDGSDLKLILRQQGTLSWEEAYAIVLQVADGLVAIHGAGIVHRDLKPANVMVDQRGVVRVLDFGIARWEEGAHTTSVVGAPGYMAPEQIRGRLLDSRTDVYCFGCLIYETFTGWPLFSADSPIGVMTKHLHEPPPLDGAGAARIPRSLIPVLARALAKEAKDRFASSHDMREELRKARASLEDDTTEVISSGASPVARGHTTLAAWILGLTASALAVALARTRTIPVPSAISPATPYESPQPTPPAASSTPNALEPTPKPRPTNGLRRSLSPTKAAPSTPPSSPAIEVPVAEPTDSPTTTTSTTTTLARALTPLLPELKVGDLVDINEPGVTPPKCEACPKPRTPLIAEHSPVAQRLRGKGYLVLLVLVDENGRVADVRPQRQVEFLSDAAVKAVRKWRFRPAAKHGIAVKVWIGVGIHFELAGEPPPVESEPFPFPPP